ncbi:hypothetical protein KI387_032353 [Taxus chinensis]|uniref:DNA damage-binding protein 1 n=1 Tax=Taxus chinensis TaxID=29808 RepID=A0AA38F3V3_TAXCH|nr:hypothetical protein KI387_032353 [Taxus chinensis]
MVWALVGTTPVSDVDQIPNLMPSVIPLVFLATGGGNLVYLEIGEGSLNEVKHLEIEYDVSCLDINPIGDNPMRSELAVVGLWKEHSIRIFSLPNLDLVTSRNLGEDVPPRSVLLCRFEGISYLLCGLGDGHLFNYVLDMSTGDLLDRKKISLGTKPITLRTFCSKSTTHVFAASDRPTVIYSSNKKLLYSNVNLKEVNHMCPFNSVSFPDSLAIAKEDLLTIGTIDDIQKLHIRAVHLGEHARRICHQEQSHTFAICTVKYSNANLDETESHFVRLLDDQTFEVISSYPLDPFENGCSILSCSFSDDNNVYYCLGTAYVMPEENEPNKGRILVFTVEDGKLQLVTEKETKGAVYNLNAFNGKLLAGINQKIQLYKWMLRDDGSRELQSECGHHGHILALYVQSRGDFIVVGDLMKSISLLIYKHEEGAIEERARDYNANWMTAVEILDDDIYLGAENNFNLFTVRKNSDAATDEERGRLEVVGEYHLGEFVNRFRHGSLVMRLPDSDSAQISTVIFGTVNGVIGVIASLPQEQYLFLEKLQQSLVKVIKGVGGLLHEQWRSFSNERKTADAKNFLDGDLIESFLDLNRIRQEEVATLTGVPVEELSHPFPYAFCIENMDTTLTEGGVMRLMSGCSDASSTFQILNICPVRSLLNSDTQHRVDLSNARVSSFNGTSLDTISTTKWFVNPVIPESLSLQEWIASDAFNVPAPSITNRVLWPPSALSSPAIIAQVLQMGNTNKNEWATITAKITDIALDNFYYLACPLVKNGTQCRKKVQELENRSWFCGKCNIPIQKCDYRYALCVTLKDGTGELQFVTAFDETAENIMGIKAEDLQFLSIDDGATTEITD